MGFIKLGYNNLLYLIIFALSSAAQMKLIELIEEYPQIIFMFLDSLSLLVLVYLEIISAYLTDNNIKTSRTSSRLLYFKTKRISILKAQERELIMRNKTIVLFIVVSLLTSLISALNYIIFFCLFIGFSGSFCFFNIVITWLLLFWYSKTKMHRHHFIALIILLTTIIISIVSNLQMFELIAIIFGNVWQFIACILLIIISLSSREVFEKYIIEVLYISHFKILFYEGVGSLIVNFVVFGVMQIFQCIKREDDYISLITFCSNGKAKTLTEYTYLLFNNGTIDTFHAWLYVIVTSVLNATRLMINKRNGPTHRYTGDLLSSALFMTIDIIITYVNQNYQLFDWKKVLIIVVLMIGCLIYNENIQFLFCNLAIYTRDEIAKRAEEDINIGMMEFDNRESIVANISYESNDDDSID